MSPSSGRRAQAEPGRRAQVEPLAAIVAVFAVAAGLAIYGGALNAAVPGSDRNLARPTLDRVTAKVGTAGVLVPAEFDTAPMVAPTGYRLNATLEAAGQRWQVGPAPPASADTASERVSVQLAPGRVRPGLLEVAVWQ